MRSDNCKQTALSFETHAADFQCEAKGDYSNMTQ
jgi:hypothetical protein